MAGGMGTSAAETILGVGWNDGSGEVCTGDEISIDPDPWFLVLDPHYTGPHQLAAIQVSDAASTPSPLIGSSIVD